MKYQLKISRIADNDRSIECVSVRFNEDSYQLRLNALIEDVSNISGVQSAMHKVVSGLDCVVIDSELNKTALLAAMEVFFKREFCYIRYDGLSEIK